MNIHLPPRGMYCRLTVSQELCLTPHVCALPENFLSVFYRTECESQRGKAIWQSKRPSPRDCLTLGALPHTQIPSQAILTSLPLVSILLCCPQNTLETAQESPGHWEQRVSPVALALRLGGDDFVSHIREAEEDSELVS